MSSVSNSTTSKRSNGNKKKICAYCGKQESDQFARHSKNQHPGQDKKEWVQGEPLLEEPWCANWKDVIFQNAQPVGIVVKFRRGTGTKFSQKGSVCSGSVAAQSIAAQSIMGDVQMQDIIQEEEKKDNGDTAVPQFIAQGTFAIGKCSPSSVLGKRLPQPPINGGLEQAVQNELQQENQSLALFPLGPVAVKSTNCRLSADNLQKLPVSQVEQQLYTPQQSYQEFLVPLSVPQTIYVDQGMRDQEAIQKLKVLDSRRTGLAKVQVHELISLVPYFTQAIVSSYIELNKSQLPHLKDLLLLAQSKVEDLTPDEISALAFACVLFGGPAWASLPRMFASLDANKLDEVLLSFHSLLSVKLSDNLAQLVCSTWRYLEEQTLPLLRYLKEQRQLKDSLVADIVTISRMVQIDDVKDYIILVEGLSRNPAFVFVLGSVQASARHWNSKQKLSFDEFACLVDFLTENSNRALIKANEEELVALPLCSWLKRLEEFKVSSNIHTVSSIQQRLDQLVELYGQLQKCHTTNLCVSDKRFSTLFNECPDTAPNALQFANSQYAAFMLKNSPKQLWCIPSGQGKSRVLATMALILLLATTVTKVHLVFDSQHLLLRDQKQFASWWILFNKQSAVQYHVGMDFVCQQGDVILVDEADELILGDPAKFLHGVQQHYCVCLTATPDNQKDKGVEREVLKLMGFSIYDGQPAPVSGAVVSQTTTNTVTTASDFQLNETLAIGPCSQELVSFIVNEIKEHAVLLYCSEEFEKLLIENKVSFTSMKDGGDINDEFLRTLDERQQNQEGTHALLVASSSFGMRGFDYRAPVKGVTLVLAASFANTRQATQGLNRVGRFGDPCKRIAVQGVDLVDKQQEILYTARLMQFLEQHLKKGAPSKLPYVNSTARTHKTSIKQQQQQQKPLSAGQSTLTSIVGIRNLNKRQSQLLSGIDTQSVKTKEDEKEEVKVINKLQ